MIDKILVLLICILVVVLGIMVYIHMRNNKPSKNPSTFNCNAIPSKEQKDNYNLWNQNDEYELRQFVQRFVVQGDIGSSMISSSSEKEIDCAIKNVMYNMNYEDWVAIQNIVRSEPTFSDLLDNFDTFLMVLKIISNSISKYQWNNISLQDFSNMLVRTEISSSNLDINCILDKLKDPNFNNTYSSLEFSFLSDFASMYNKHSSSVIFPQSVITFSGIMDKLLQVCTM